MRKLARSYPVKEHLEGNVFSQVDKFTVQDLEKALLERKEPMIIDFYATWCGPCLLLSKELEEVPPISLSKSG